MIIKGIKVGKTDITSNYNEGVNKSDTKSLIVTSVSLGTISNPDESVYTGNPQTPTPVVRALVAGEYVELVNEEDYELSYLNNVNVGTATVVATGKGNYSGEISVTWNITPADIYVNQNDQIKIYDGILMGNPISATTVSNQEATIKYGKSDGIYNLNNTPQIKDVTESCTVYYQVSAPNHTTITGSYTLEITPKEATLQWGISSWTYDGKSHYTTCTVTNLIGSDECDVILSGNSIIDIGTVTVIATSLSNTNYKLPANGLTQVITINPGMFVKIGGVWNPVKEIYKKIGGTWVKQDSATGHFLTSSEGGRYLKK